MKIVSFNINGIRAAITKGLWDWIREEQPDYIGFQEVKAGQEQVDLEKMTELGYHAYWHSAEKKGYSGVAVFSRRVPDLVETGMQMEKYDSEGRIIRTDFGELSVVNCYFPSGSSSEDRHAFKLEFLEDFTPWIKKLKSERPNLIVLGDYNIVHTGMDIHNPDRKDNPSGYRPEEREWMDKWFDLGFTDAFRFSHPEEISFSWWSYRAGSWQKNKGWRIDYCSVTNDLANRIIDCRHQKEIRISDHCPVILEIR